MQNIELPVLLSNSQIVLKHTIIWFLFLPLNKINTTGLSILFNNMVFGPVKSRRLGISLGINLLPAESKFCNFDCIYCECGLNKDNRSKKIIFCSREDLSSALESKLNEMKANNELPDAITFSGNGEPTLHPLFDDIVNDVIVLRNKYSPKAIVCVLTNGTTISDPQIAAALKKADKAIIKIDSGIEETAKIIDAPAGNYSLAKQIELLKAFEGKIVLQTMFLKGVFNGVSIDNTSEKEIEAWLDVVKQINPGEITIYTIDRDTPTTGLQKISAEKLEEIAQRARKIGFKVQVSS